MREEIENWWKQAKKDLNSAEKNFYIKEYNLTAFLCQQAVEKGLKALDIKKSNKLIKTHDLIFLSKKINAPEEIIEKCIKINPVYTDSRYPDFIEVETYTKEKSKEILFFAKEILKWIKKRLSI